MEKLEFPLAKTYTFKLGCKKCFNFISVTSYLLERNEMVHACAEDILAVQKPTDKLWINVRERRSHRPPNGTYQLCWKFHRKPPRPCKVGDKRQAIGDKRCRFPHNKVEQKLWNLEKDQKFDIREFISQNRSKRSSRTFAEELLRNNPGLMEFRCKECFYGRPIRLSEPSKDRPDICSANLHRWDVNKLLVHFSDQGQINSIESCPRSSNFQPCPKDRFCPNRRERKCHYYHSLVERDVWMAERGKQVSRDELVQCSTESESAEHGTFINVQQQPPVGCPYCIKDVCAICWSQGVLSEQGENDRCNAKANHMWSINITYLLVPNNKVIHSLPRRIPAGFKFAICRKGRQCNLGNSCSFAHSKEEIEVWTWMAEHGGKKQEHT